MNPERSVLRIRTGNYFKTTVLRLTIRSINDRDETDKIFLLFVPIFTSAVQIISSSILKESIWLLHVTGRLFVFDFFLIVEMIAARVRSNSSELLAATR